MKYFIRGLSLGLMLAVCASFVAAPKAANAQATKAVGSNTGYPLPRYVSIRNAPAHLRLGPSKAHKIDWTLMHAGMPVQVIDEEGLWRQVKLYDGLRGWMHKSLLVGARSLLVVSNGRATIHSKADGDSRVVAYAERGVILRTPECTPRWCRVRKGEVKGWVSRRQVWGVEANETFK